MAAHLCDRRLTVDASKFAIDQKCREPHGKLAEKVRVIGIREVQHAGEIAGSCDPLVFPSDRNTSLIFVVEIEIRIPEGDGGPQFDEHVGANLGFTIVEDAEVARLYAIENDVEDRPVWACRRRSSGRGYRKVAAFLGFLVVEPPLYYFATKFLPGRLIVTNASPFSHP
jgi:hypothetical protein